MIESPLIQEIIEEAEIRRMQKDILAFLKGRFGPLPRPLIATVQCVNDERTLFKLMARASKCTSLDSFQRAIPAKR